MHNRSPLIFGEGTAQSQQARSSDCGMHAWGHSGLPFWLFRTIVCLACCLFFAHLPYGPGGFWTPDHRPSSPPLEAGTLPPTPHSLPQPCPWISPVFPGFHYIPAPRRPSRLSSAGGLLPAAGLSQPDCGQEGGARGAGPGARWLREARSREGGPRGAGPGARLLGGARRERGIPSRPKSAGRVIGCVPAQPPSCPAGQERIRFLFSITYGWKRQ